MTVHEDVYHFSDNVGWCRSLSDDIAAVGTCLLVAGGEPCAETAVAICVAAGDNVGFVHETFADLACHELSQVVKVTSECGECLSGIR
jgi:hypothetical protein